jgi:hypothetical protein
MLWLSFARPVYLTLLFNWENKAVFRCAKIVLFRERHVD